MHFGSPDIGNAVAVRDNRALVHNLPLSCSCAAHSAQWHHRLSLLAARDRVPGLCAGYLATGFHSVASGTACSWQFLLAAALVPVLPMGWIYAPDYADDHRILARSHTSNGAGAHPRTGWPAMAGTAGIVARARTLLWQAAFHRALRQTMVRSAGRIQRADPQRSARAGIGAFGPFARVSLAGSDLRVAVAHTPRPGRHR